MRIVFEATTESHLRDDADIALLSAMVSPIIQPIRQPTIIPTTQPTFLPTRAPTLIPTAKPTAKPTDSPSFRPTLQPTLIPTAKPTTRPTDPPSFRPTLQPTPTPTLSADVYIIDTTVLVLLFMTAVFLVWILTAPTNESYSYPSDGTERLVQQISAYCYYYTDWIVQPFLSCISFCREGYSYRQI